MRRIGWMAALAAAVLAAPASAQVSDRHAFIEAVKDRDSSKATELLNARGPSVIDGRNHAGETALLSAIANRDSTWTLFLLQKGADPNLAGRDGETPLIAAARLGFDDAVDWLLSRGAKVDLSNGLRETPLIVAVQRRHESIVKALLDKGANPDLADAAAGYTARDYAKRDARSRDILALIEGAGKKGEDSAETATEGESLDDFKLIGS